MKFFKFFLKPKTLSQKILATIFVISSLVTLIITTAQLSFDYFQEMSALEKTLHLIDKSYTKSIAASLWQLSDAQIKTGLDGIVSIPGIQYAAIVDKNKVIAKSGELGNVQTIHKTFKIIHMDTTGDAKYIGNLMVYANVDQVLDKIYQKILILFITQFIKTLLVSFLIYLSIQQIITKHLVHISQYLKKIDFKSTDREKDLVLDRKDSEFENPDELDVLTNSINNMRQEINSSYNSLSLLNKNLEDKVEENTRLILVQHQKLEYAAKMSTLGEMAGGIAHEINNPLTIISSVSRILRKYTDKGMIEPEKIYKSCDDIDKTVERMSKIILGLRTVSRDASEEEFHPCRIGDVLEDVMALCSEKFKVKGIVVKIDMSASVYDTIIPCRRVQLSQVFLNLLGNSYDAIENLQNPWIKIDCINQGEKLLLRFTDSGSGIPMEIQKKMLQPFFTTKAVGKGTGLGLSLSSSILKSHNGHLDIDNNCKNTCFVIVLPVAGVVYAKAQ